MLSLGVLVTNYNTWELALDCVRAHRRLHGDRLARIVLLDDCSPRPPPAGIEEEPGVEILRNERNLGFSANLNKGVRAVGTDLVLLFDADAYPLNPYYDAVVAAFEADPHLAILGFGTEAADGRYTAAILPVPGVLLLVLGQSWFTHYRRVFKEPASAATRYYIPTAAMAVRRAAFDAVGGFDERLQWIDVDTDFSMMLNHTPPWTLRKGEGPLARHEYGGTPVSESARVLKFHAARWYLLRKHGLIVHPRAVKAALLLRIALEWVMVAALGRWFYRRDPDRRRDKLEIRRRLLSHAWRHFA